MSRCETAGESRTLALSASTIILSIELVKGQQLSDVYLLRDDERVADTRISTFVYGISLLPAKRRFISASRTTY